MNYQTDIRAPMVSLLETLAGSIPIKGDNINFKAPKESPWIGIYFMPNQSIGTTLGDDGLNETTGILQVDLNWPLNTGDSEQAALISQLYSAFNLGKEFISNDVSTKITRFGPTAGVEVNSYWRISVTIGWYSFSKRNP